MVRRLTTRLSAFRFLSFFCCFVIASVSEAIQYRDKDWVASSLQLLAMTREVLCRLQNSDARKPRRENDIVYASLMVR